MTRKEILAAAEKCVCGDREQDYGIPENSFRLIAEFWHTYLSAKCVAAGVHVQLEPEDVAAMMALLKIARVSVNPEHVDSWIDGAGYMACGGELATLGEKGLRINRGGPGMTREEIAIKSCEDRIKHLKSAPPHHYGKRQRERAIELEKVKIKALRPVSREQVEKVWRGEWEEERFAGELEGWQHRECGRHSTEKSMWCPKCGKAMTDEAVEMVMERLEILYANIE